MILKRFNYLVSQVVTEGDGRQFLKTVVECCNGKNRKELHKDKWRTIGVRNIIGLYVGQDIPNKAAFAHYKRLQELVLKTPKKSNYVPAKEKKKKRCVGWSMEDFINLMEEVLAAQPSVE